MSGLLKKHPDEVPGLAKGTGKEVVDRGGGDGEIFGENQRILAKPMARVSPGLGDWSV